MNKNVKKKWIKALRSGGYEQGHGALCTVTEAGDEFCCLGVLCELHAQATGGVWEEGQGVQALIAGLGLCYAGDPFMPPEDVLRWAGIDEGEPLHRPITLSEMNDIEERSFSQIADWIEANL